MKSHRKEMGMGNVTYATNLSILIAGIDTKTFITLIIAPVHVKIATKLHAKVACPIKNARIVFPNASFVKSQRFVRGMMHQMIGVMIIWKAFHVHSAKIDAALNASFRALYVV
jgi:hypothetical protein